MYMDRKNIKSDYHNAYSYFLFTLFAPFMLLLFYIISSNATDPPPDCEEPDMFEFRVKNPSDSVAYTHRTFLAGTPVIYDATINVEQERSILFKVLSTIWDDNEDDYVPWLAPYDPSCDTEYRVNWNVSPAPTLSSSGNEWRIYTFDERGYYVIRAQHMGFVFTDCYCAGLYSGPSAWGTAKIHVLDARDRLIVEYQEADFGYVPEREDFLDDDSYVDPGNFPFTEINGGEYDYVLFSIAGNLQSLRNTVGKSMSVTSGYRNPVYNASLPGSSSTSRHMYGDAADIANNDFDNDGDTDTQDLYYLETLADNMGASTTIVYPDRNFIHIDWR